MTTAFQSSLKYQVPQPSKDERYDLVQLKEQLAEALGDDGPSYWEALRISVQGTKRQEPLDMISIYLTAKVNKNEWFYNAKDKNIKEGKLLFY